MPDVALEAGEPLLLAATISGTDMLFATITQSMQKYSGAEIRMDDEFADMVFEDGDGMRVELNRLDLVERITG